MHQICGGYCCNLLAFVTDFKYENILNEVIVSGSIIFVIVVEEIISSKSLCERLYGINVILMQEKTPRKMLRTQEKHRELYLELCVATLN